MTGHDLRRRYRWFPWHRLRGVLKALELAAGIAVFLAALQIGRYAREADRWLLHTAQSYRLHVIWTAPRQEAAQGPGGVVVVALTGCGGEQSAVPTTDLLIRLSIDGASVTMVTHAPGHADLASRRIAMLEHRIGTAVHNVI